MPNQINRFLNYFSRSAVRVRNILGVIPTEDREGVRKTRNKTLELYDAYYESTQYLKLPEWDQSNDKSDEYIPVRKRQPRIIYNFAKVLCDRIASKLVGLDTFPQFKIEDDPDTTTFIRLVMKEAKVRSKIMDTIKLMARSGSSFLRFYIDEGTMICETYHSNFCYPEFKTNGRLKFIKIKYVYDDEQDLDTSGKPKQKWYRLDLTDKADILYDTPEYQADAEPTFTVVSTTQHNLGFVQGEWFRTSIDKHCPDGYSLIGDILDFIDEFNYSLSQSSLAVGYGQEPQLSLSGMDVDEIDRLIKSSTKAWNLGREGKAGFVETNLQGVQVAIELRDKVRQHVQDIARVLMLDPEKMTAHAQSGEAMKVLHGPMVELINELRPLVEDSLIELITKMSVAILYVNQQGFETDLVIPEGFEPTSFDISATWPPIFPMTLDDLLKKSQIAITLSAARILSEEWATGWMASDVGIEDVAEELDKLAAQPIMSPFGPMDGTMAPLPGNDLHPDNQAPNA